jgi:hypothetical protein
MTTLTSLPTKATTSVMGRKTTCNGCGYEQWTVTSYHLDRKEWQRVHTLDFCRQRKNDQAVDDLIGKLFMS